MNETMKSTGIVRKVDELGRIVLPIEMRRTLGIGEKDSLEIFIDGETVVLKKYSPACIFCGSARITSTTKGSGFAGIVSQICEVVPEGVFYAPSTFFIHLHGLASPPASYFFYPQ